MKFKSNTILYFSHRSRALFSEAGELYHQNYTVPH